MKKLFLATAISCIAIQSFAISADYTLTFDLNNLKVTVKVILPATDTLQMHASAPLDDKPEGWASFIKNIRVSGANKKSIPIQYIGKSLWALQSKAEKNITLEYEVDLSLAKQNWSVGNEQIGFWDELNQSLFVVNKSLFIYSPSLSYFNIHINIPNGNRLSAPWSPNKIIFNQYDFSVENQELLLINSMVVGKHQPILLPTKDFTFEIVLLGKMQEDSAHVAKVLQKVNESYLSLFGAVPVKRYLFTLLPGNTEDGEAYQSSSCFTTFGNLKPDKAILWGSTLAHEYFHLWNGHTLQAEVRNDMRWFAEGFTEYYANMALYRSKLITHEQFLRKWENNLARYAFFRYSSLTDTVSLVRAGYRGAYRMGVYSGGWAIAFALDVKIRQNTNNQKGLDDFIKTLYADFGATKQAFSAEDWINIASKIANEDLHNWFNQYIKGRDRLPLETLCNYVGYDIFITDYECEAFLMPESSNSANFRSWINSTLR